MKEEAEGRRLQATLKGILTQGAAGDRLKNSDWTYVVAQSEKDAGIGDVERAGDQTADENSFGRTSFPHGTAGTRLLSLSGF